MTRRKTETEQKGESRMEQDIKLTKLAKCAGCGAKVGAGVLSQLLEGLPVRRDENLLVGFDRSDDASVYRISPELALVQTVDFFPPIADDPYTYGAIAAANALSDVYAMGGEPKLALNVMAVPEDMPKEVVHQILRGGYEEVYEAGAMITGGHSILDPEPKYGLAVTGFVHPDRVITNSGAKPGDVLLLTKPVGIGVLTAAMKGDLADEETRAYAYSLMMTLNRAARDCMVKYRVHACTDVTGFGVLGHLLEMAQGSGVEIHLSLSGVQFLPQSVAFARMGLLPEGMYRNRAFAESAVDLGDVPMEYQDLLFDPQTSGGLCIAVDPNDAPALLSELEGAVPAAQRIGVVAEYRGGKRIFLSAAPRPAGNVFSAALA
ncbi:MAG: selenide, water dikinase SelD [Oscillospiraceae bacterium]|nr:selenide, water dikinase SelD [Oscillospiraceae bacterium]